MTDKDLIDHLIRNLEKINDRLIDIEKIQSAHLVVLKDHTRRSLANEEALNLYRQEVKMMMLPIEKHVSKVENALRFIALFVGGVSVLTGIIVGIVELVQKLN